MLKACVVDGVLIRVSRAIGVVEVTSAWNDCPAASEIGAAVIVGRLVASSRTIVEVWRVVDLGVGVGLRSVAGSTAPATRTEASGK